MGTIQSRRSIRKYTDERVSDEIVTEILKAAMSAPSAGNQRPWHFVVVRNKDVLDLVPAIHAHAAMVPHASVLIAVCADMRSLKFRGYWVQDCSAASENVLLAAHEMGLGAVWTGVYPTKKRVEGFRRLLGLPEYVVPFSFIPVGYPAESPPEANRFDPSRVHYDRW